MKKLNNTQSFRIKNEFFFLAELFNFKLNQKNNFFKCLDLFFPMDESTFIEIKNQLLNGLKLLKFNSDLLRTNPEDCKKESLRLKAIETNLKKLKPLLEESICYYSTFDAQFRETDSYKYLQLLYSIINTHIIDNDVLWAAKASSDVYSSHKVISHRPQKSPDEKIAYLLLVRSFNKLISSKERILTIQHGLPLNLFQSKTNVQNKKVTPTLLMMLFLNLINEDKNERSINNHLNYTPAEIVKDGQTLEELNLIIDNYALSPPEEFTYSNIEMNKNDQLMLAKLELIYSLDLNEIFREETTFRDENADVE